MNIRKLISRPGFEFIFALGIAAIFILPSAVMAQDHKNIDITVMNGDTTINGRNIKELSPKERADALADLKNISAKHHDRMQRRSLPMQPAQQQAMQPQQHGDDYGDYKPLTDDAHKELHVRRRIIIRDSVANHNFDKGGNMPPMGDRPMGNMPNDDVHNFHRMHGGSSGGMIFNHRNSQTFSYVSTDDNGITTSISFRVFEHPGDPFNKGEDAGKDAFDVTDLKLVPDFTSGKVSLMFELPSKTIAQVSLTNSEGNVLWSDKSAAGVFNKSFALPLNGMYFLKIKQGGKIATKQIFREE